jgi:hypothetical protein
MKPVSHPIACQSDGSGHALADAGRADRPAHDDRCRPFSPMTSAKAIGMLNNARFNGGVA